eukprot:UN00955
MAEQKIDAPSIRISYFPMQGRAGALRAAAAVGGLSYEDEFVSFEEQKQAKADGKRRWTGLPEMTLFSKEGREVQRIGQSNACLRYIGGLSGLYPTRNRLFRAYVDEIIDSIEDVIKMISSSIHEKDEEKKKTMRLALMKDDKLPFWFSKFEQRFAENGRKGNKNGYFVGDNLTVADIKFYFIGDWIMSGKLDHIDSDKLMLPGQRCVAFVEKLKENQAMKKMFAEFARSQKEYKENKTTRFKRAGKITIYM